MRVGDGDRKVEGAGFLDDVRAGQFAIAVLAEDAGEDRRGQVGAPPASKPAAAKPAASKPKEPGNQGSLF